MPSQPIFIATRGSPLALAQANLILSECRGVFSDQDFELKIIKTTGDKIQTASLAAASLPKGLFTKELEVALLSREADLAVHSLKDLPTELPPGLKLGAVGRRADVRDLLIQRAGDSRSRPAIRDLPKGATVATSSTRRSAQLLEQRADLEVVPIRGNVATRLQKLAAQPELAATILAAAGLERLKIKIEPDGRLHGDGIPDGLIGTMIELDEMLPCVGQGALGLEVRENDPPLERICARLDHLETHQCVLAERAFLRGMGGGCQLAVGAHAEILGDQIRMRVVSFLGKKVQRREARRAASEGETLGAQLAAACSRKAS